MNLTVFTAIVVAVLVANIAFGFIRRKAITLSVYEADPDKHPWWVVALTLTGTIVGGGMFLAVGQIGYEAGVTGYFLGVIYLVGLAAVAALAKRARRMLDDGGHETVIELIEAAYAKRVVFQFCAVGLVMYLFLLAGQFVALFKFAEFVSEKNGATVLPWCLVGIAALSLFLYPVIGGVRKDIRTDVIQMILVLFASAAVMLHLSRLGLRDAVFTKLTPEHLTGTGYGVVFIVGAILFLTPSFLVRMDVWQRIRTAKTTAHAKWGFLVAAVGSCFFYFLFTTVGMWAFASGNEGGINASLDVIYEQFSNPWTLGTIIGAFFAAVLSSADTFINNTSIFAARLTLESEWQKKGTDKAAAAKVLLWSRGFALGLTAIAIGLAVASPDFVDLLVGALSILLLFLPTICGLFVQEWRHTNAAFWSTNVGLLLFLCCFFAWEPKLAFAPAVLASGVLFPVIRARWPSGNGA